MSWEAVVIAPRYAVRVQDLDVTDVLVVRCEGCGREWQLCPGTLLAKFPPYKRIVDLASGFHCKTCRGGACSWRTMRAVPP